MIKVGDGVTPAQPSLNVLAEDLQSTIISKAQRHINPDLLFDFPDENIPFPPLPGIGAKITPKVLLTKFFSTVLKGFHFIFDSIEELIKPSIKTEPDQVSREEVRSLINRLNKHNDILLPPIANKLKLRIDQVPDDRGFVLSQIDRVQNENQREYLRDFIPDIQMRSEEEILSAKEIDLSPEKTIEKNKITQEVVKAAIKRVINSNPGNDWDLRTVEVEEAAKIMHEYLEQQPGKLDFILEEIGKVKNSTDKRYLMEEFGPPDIHF